MQSKRTASYVLQAGAKTTVWLLKKLMACSIFSLLTQVIMIMCREHVCTTFLKNCDSMPQCAFMKNYGFHFFCRFQYKKCILTPSRNLSKHILAGPKTIKKLVSYTTNISGKSPYWDEWELVRSILVRSSIFSWEVIISSMWEPRSS